MLDQLSGLLYYFIILALAKPTFRLIQTIYELISRCASKPVDLRKKFGDWAVITGSTDGIGKEYAKELASRHLNIVLISRSIEKLNNTKDEIQKIDPTIQVKIIQADFSKGREEFKNIMHHLQNVPVGILVNNVGKLTDYPMYLGEMPEDDLWDIINLNVSTTTVMTHMVIEQMKKRGKGAVVNLSSASDLAPVPLLAVYSASKIFIRYFSEAIREEYSKYGITVQCLSPYFINTSMVKFSERIQNNPLVPDAAKYARNAIETLGKIDSTTGYWVHDILAFLSIFVPYTIYVKASSLLFGMFRKEFFAKQKKLHQ